MDPLAVYICIVVIMLAASAAVKIWHHAPTRSCPLCDSRVELGRVRCQTCGYSFSTARM